MGKAQKNLRKETIRGLEEVKRKEREWVKGHMELRKRKGNKGETGYKEWGSKFAGMERSGEGHTLLRMF